jgi:hypothetical protein
LGDFFFVFLDFVDCPLEVIDGTVDIIDQLLLLAKLCCKDSFALRELVCVDFELVYLPLQLSLCDRDLLQLGFLLLKF